MIAVINRRRYDTESATPLAEDACSDGSCQMVRGTSTHLYRTQLGQYFVYTATGVQGEHDSIDPCSAKDAESVYESLCNQLLPFEDAFPDVVVEDA